MKQLSVAASALCTAAMLLLVGCGSDGTGAEDIESGQVPAVPAGTFATVDELADHLGEELDEIDVYLESVAYPDFNPEHELDRLHVEFASEGLTNADKLATAEVIHAVAGAEFPYWLLMVTGRGDTGTWSYVYDAATVESLTDGRTIEVDTVWDSADQDFDTVHR